jgi:hypothetical protein
MRSLRFRLFLLAFLASGSAGAQNLLTNPTFDTTTTPWVLSFNGTGTGALAWSSLDSASSLSSGSALITNTSPGPAGSTTDSVLVTSCVAASPGTIYNFGTKYFVATGQPAVEIRANYRFFITTDCTGGANAVGGCFIGTATGYWTSLGTCSSPPSGASIQSASLVLITTKLLGGGSVDVNFDNAYFEIGLTPVQLSHFEID